MTDETLGPTPTEMGVEEPKKTPEQVEQETIEFINGEGLKNLPDIIYNSFEVLFPKKNEIFKNPKDQEKFIMMLEKFLANLRAENKNRR